MTEQTKDEDKSQAQLINELQLIRWRVGKFEQDELRYKQFLEEYEETVTEHFDIYYHSHDMVVSVDMQTEKVLQCNKAVIETLGYGRAEIVGHPVFQLYHQDYVEDAKELFRVITETGEIRDAEQTLWKRDGGKISVSLNATSIRNENENPTSMLFDWRNITRRAVEIGDLRSENRQLKEHLRSNRPEHPEVFSDIVTQDPAMYSIFHQVESIAVTGQPVLITGETGVGKEKIAEAIHQLSGRLGEFVPVNIAGLDDLMFSDTFFGHRRGAFTGADSARHGLIEQASGGTLFLDEIGDLGMESQTKLLRFYRMENTVIWVKTPQLEATLGSLRQPIKQLNRSREAGTFAATSTIASKPIIFICLRCVRARGTFLCSYPISSNEPPKGSERKYPSHHRNSLRCFRPTTSPETSGSLRGW